MFPTTITIYLALTWFAAWFCALFGGALGWTLGSVLMGRATRSI